MRRRLLTSDDIFPLASPICHRITQLPEEDWEEALSEITEFVKSMLRHPGTTGRLR